MVIENKDWVNWTSTMSAFPGKETESTSGGGITRPRPGHADLAGAIKWNHRDIRNVLERASARETAARVALGSLARQLLEHFRIRFASHVISIGDRHLPADYRRPPTEDIIRLSESSSVRCIDKDTEQQMLDAITGAIDAKDTLGGIAELVVCGVPVGLGSLSQWQQRLDGRLAGAMMAVPSVKGVEIGLGFAATRQGGSAVHDEIFYRADGEPAKKKFYRNTNNAGGIEGGITNGEDIVIRVAVKPISTLRKPLRTIDINSKQSARAVVERSDVCVVPSVAVITEAVAALVLTGVFLEKFGADNLAETERNYDAFLRTEY